MKRLKILLLLVLAISCSKRKVEIYPESNVSVSAGSDDHQGDPATGEQAKHGPSKAVQHFKGEDQGGIDLRKYDSWYDNTTLEYLANTLRATQRYLLKVVFHDPMAPKTSFANQVAQLQVLKSTLNRKAALFISKKPGAGMNHYLFGMLYGNKLILLNPVGASKHQDLYEALAAVKEQGLVEELFLSRTRIQQEEQLVSCGPISAELVLHYGALDEEGLEEVVSKLCSVGEAQEKKLGQGQEAKTLCYQEVAVSPWLPASLLGLVQEESGAKASYEERVAELRQSQLARLEQVPRELEEELPEQVLFTQLVVEDKGILALADSESYKQLAKRARPSELACSPIPGSGLEVGESVSQLPSTSQAVHVSTPAEPQQAARARSHAVPRAPLELTESQGPTELERDQQEAAKLKEEIAELYSRPPQATEEADSQIVHELTTRLARLLKLEGFWTLEQDGDGAKEYIERLRKDHRTRWGQTEYGAEVNKELTALLEQAYGEALKQGASEKLVNKTPEGVARLAKVLEQLAALHQERGEQTGDLTYYPEAAVFYQNVLSVCEEEMKKVESQAAEALGYPAQIAAAYSGLAKIREAMLAIAKGGKEGVVSQGGMSVAELQEEIARDKQVLQALRTDAKARVDQLEAFLNKQGSAEEVLAGEKEYIEGSRALFADIAKTVREFLARLYQESEQELGPAPCKYTVMGLGSMALEQMTPYSDLEFAILVEEAKDAAAAEEYREYLRQLTHLVHFRVINLGETTIPMSKYGMSLDHLAKRGIHFDLGGITPLGRKDKLYDLIQPVAGMLYYLKNEGNKIAHIDKPLPFILESTCYVHGEEGLHEAYAAEKRAFLEEGQTEQGVPIYQARALKRLLKGFVELDYSNLGEVKARRQQPGDLGDLKPKFELEDAGRLYDVKQIYRLPNRLLYGLAMYYGILPASSWDAVEQLASRGIIGVGTGAQEAAHHLQYAVSFATILRLKTYLHHEQQAERVTMLSGVSPEQAQQEVSEFFTLPPAALQAGGSLFKYYYTALPLHSKIEEFFKTLGLRQQLSEWSEVLGLDNDLSYQLKTLFEVEDKFSPSKEADFFQAEAFYDDSDEARGNIHRRLLRYKEAKACYEQALAITEQVYGPEHPNVAKSLNNLGLVEDPKEAIECFKRALAIYEQACGPKHPEVARSLNNLGLAWYQLGDWKQAIECFKRALAIYKKSYGPEHSNVATILNNLGDALDQLGESKQAIECFKWALAIYEQTYGPEHPEVARSLNNLGLAWYHLGESKQAIGYFERALAIYEQAYGPEHSNVATSLNNLGLGWDNLGEHQKAIGYYEGALAIYEKVCSPKHHPLVATSLNNLGGALDQLGDWKQALSYYKRALAINKQAYSPEHPEVATSLNILGVAWYHLGESKQAIGYFERALAIHEQAYGPEHPEVARSLNNLGSAWNRLGDWKQAFSYYKRTLAIYEQAYGPEHPEVARSLNNLGSAWNRLGDWKQAISYYKRALAINEQAYGLEHPKVATSLNNLGSAWIQLGESKQAIGYFKRALAIHEQADGPEYPHVATILTNLGNACYQLGDPKQAIGYCERALAIAQQVCGPEHPNAATSLNILGGAYEKLGDWKQAFSYYKRTLAIHEQADGPEHPNVATSLNNLGEAWFQLGKPKQAISCYNRALAIREKTYGQEHPDVAMTLNNLGGAWDQLGDSKQAIRYFERALAIREKIYGPEHLEVAKRLDNLGGAWYKLGDWKQAFSYFERAFHIMKKAYGEHHPSTQRIKRNMEQLSGRLENNVEHQVGLFVKACVAGNEDLAISMPMRLFRKDLYDDKGNPLICWMAQHEMITTLEKVLKLGWNPNLPNTIQVYPLHYVAMKNPGLIQLLLPYADPFVQAAQGSTPAMVAKNKGKMKALSLLLPSITGLSLQNPAAFDTSYATCKAHFLATPTHSLEHLVQVFSLACHFKDWELARGVATRHNLRPIISQVTKQYPAAGKTLFACIDSFTEACKEGNDTLALEIAGQFTFEKDLYDAQGNPLICWMAQHAMTATLEQVLKLGWNPNLPNPRQVYPLHYGTMENPSLTSLLLQAGAHPFVQTPKGNTPAQVARNKGKVATLAVLLPSLEGISFEDAAAFEETYQAYKQRFSTHHQGSEELLAALALALQLGDADLTLAIQAKQASQNLLEQLIDQYPLAAETIQARFESILKGTVDEQFPS